MKIILEKISIFLIIIIASFLRLSNLASVPIGFNDDEAAFGYNAHSIIKTGKDEWGRTLPFPAFESFGDWKLVGYLYPVVISQAIFGENEFATRLPSAIFGIVAVFASYLLAKRIFNQKVAIIASLLLAISPWHIIASRNAFESDSLILFLTLATFLFLKGIDKKVFLTLSFITFALSSYLYRSSWLFMPIFVSFLIYLNRKSLLDSRSFLIKNIVLAAIIILPLIPTVLTFKGQSRFFQESFITGVQKSGIIDEINQKRGACAKSRQVLLCTLTYNKYSSYIFRYSANYISNLSPQVYYILPTPAGYQGFSTRAPFPLFEFPLFILGLFFIFKRRLNKAYLLIAWILIVPLGASFTGIGNLGRLNILMPAPQIISAFGIFSLLEILKSHALRRVAIIAIIYLAVISSTGTILDLFYYIPEVSARNQRYGYKQLFDYLESQKANFDQIAISRKNDDAKQYIHYLFFEKVDPVKFLNPQITKRYRGSDNWQVVEKIDKFYFYPSTPSIENLHPKSLLAVGEKEATFSTNPVFTINDPKGDKIFEVYNVEEITKSQDDAKRDEIRKK